MTNLIDLITDNFSQPVLSAFGYEPCCVNPKHLTIALLVSGASFVLYTLFNIVGGQIAESTISDQKGSKTKTH